MADNCATSGLCPVNEGFFVRNPSVGASAFFVTAFGILTPIAFMLGFKHTTAGFSSFLILGLLIEVVGFVGRLLLIQNLASQTNFGLWLVGSILGPTLFAASIFSTLPSLLLVLQGHHRIPLKPSQVSLLSTVLASGVIVLEIVGSIYLVFHYTNSKATQGARLIISGLALQTACLVVSVGAYTHFLTTSRGTGLRLDPNNSELQRSPRFRRCLFVLQLSSVLLLAYSIFETVKIATGLGSSLAQNEIASMVMDGAIPLLVSLILVVFHPGRIIAPVLVQQQAPWYRTRRNIPAPLTSAPGPYHGSPYTEQVSDGRYSLRRVEPAIYSPQRSPGSPYELRYSSPPSGTFQQSPTAASYHSTYTSPMNSPPDAYMPTYSSPGYPSPGYSSVGYPSPGNPPQGHTPPENQPSGHPSPGYPPSGHPSPGFSMSGQDSRRTSRQAQKGAPKKADLVDEDQLW